MKKRFIFSVVVMVIFLPFQSFGVKDQKTPDTNSDEEKVRNLLRPRKPPFKRTLKSTKGATFCVPQISGKYNLEEQPHFLQEKALNNTFQNLKLD